MRQQPSSILNVVFGSDLEGLGSNWPGWASFSCCICQLGKLRAVNGQSSTGYSRL